MHIRRLQQNDQQDVIHIFEEYPLQFPSFVVARYPVRWREYFTTSSYKSEYYIAEEDGIVCGHTGFIYNDEAGLYEIVGVVVKNSAARKGIGRALISSICDRLRELNEEKVILYTLGHPGNEGTIDFYRNIGFDLIKEEQDFFTEGYHRVTFMKILNGG
ncbi:GNAT family N-acetyltransferase [Paenibacillus lupini]|uniref:GNAT family N-acetyltransferase n=1 Tax=Paenibacillus lupini TaxID=1450204 RepID=UPI00141D7F33|nr:GNAT family N-acetyltransferase [Paenibacillus lupini]NIK23281.1 N-acetylglutamate synthase-like GNAT family acetyltransferase [Paenibacillus lupini]